MQIAIYKEATRCAALAGLALLIQLAPGCSKTTPPRVPAGIYTNFVMDGAIRDAKMAAYPGRVSQEPAYPNPLLTPDPTDTVLIDYFTTLLNNGAISGLAPMVQWSLLNPSDPELPDGGTELPDGGAYTWNALNDVFTAVDGWNKANPHKTAKTIQLIVSPGFNSPSWIFSKIDADVCGQQTSASCTGSCDPLFMTPTPMVSALPACGYTTLFYQVEGAGAAVQQPLPLPWSLSYKSAWRTFLVALNQQIQTEPSSTAFVSIAIAGPTASSAEMILPNKSNQMVDGNNGILTLAPMYLPANEMTLPNLDVATAWNLLFQQQYNSNPNYQDSDQAFVDEWNAAIDLYGEVFSGVTLVLTTTTDALPTFDVAPGSPLLLPAPGFASDCDDPNNADNAMGCATVTQVLAHYTNPDAGGSNSKATQESGMTASRDGVDLGTNGIKWLAFATSGLAPLPGTTFETSRILGGLQFSRSFSGDAGQFEGCPGYPSPCTGLTPEEGLANVLQQSYFVGTDAGPAVGALASVTDAGNFTYGDAPMNYLQIYDTDVLYASGLANCAMIDITGSPDNNLGPDAGDCMPASTDPYYQSAQATQSELNQASQLLLEIAEPPSAP